MQIVQNQGNLHGFWADNGGQDIPRGLGCGRGAVNMAGDLVRIFSETKRRNGFH